MARNDSVELFVTFLRETEAAVHIDDGCTQVWIPKSQLVDFESWTLSHGEELVITCSQWFAEQNHLV